jgi:hypothetical protein
LLEGVLFDALSPGRTANAEIVGTSSNDVSTLSTLGEMVQTMGSTADALSLGVVGTFWRLSTPRQLLRIWLVWELRLAAREKEFQPEKLNHPKCQTGSSGFLEKHRSALTTMQAVST